MVVWTMLFIYEFHNKSLFLGHSEMVDFWPYLMVFKAAVPEIFLYKVLDFFGLEVFYIRVDNFPKCRI